MSPVLHHENQDDVRKAVLLGFGHSVTLTLQMAIQQMLGQSLSLALLVAVNATFLLVVVFAASLYRGHWHYYTTHYPRQQLVRCLLRVVANITGLYALIHMPLTTNIVIGFLSPLAVAFFSTIFLHEPLVRRALVSTGLGLAGMFIILSVESAPWWPMFLAFVTVLISSLNGVLVRQMPRDHPFTFMLYTNITLACCFWPFAWAEVPKLALPTLVMLGWAGLLSVFASYAYFRANLIASPQHSAPLQYLQLLWGAGLAWLLQNHVPAPGFWLGALLIVAGSFFLLQRKKTST